jgi:hypothetical protein
MNDVFSLSLECNISEERTEPLFVLNIFSMCDMFTLMTITIFCVTITNRFVAVLTIID